MALFHGVINSKALMKDTTLSMIVPSDDRKNIGFQGQPQLLILLHGAGGSNYTWSKYSSIERYSRPCKSQCQSSLAHRTAGRFEQCHQGLISHHRRLQRGTSAFRQPPQNNVLLLL